MARRESRNQSVNGGSFLMGVVTGGAVATGLALYFFPQLTEARERLISSAAGLRDAASDGIQTVEDRVADVLDRAADVADDVTERAQAVREEVAGAVEYSARAVSRGAREVERFTKPSETDQHGNGRNRTV